MLPWILQIEGVLGPQNNLIISSKLVLVLQCLQVLANVGICFRFGCHWDVEPIQLLLDFSRWLELIRNLLQFLLCRRRITYSFRIFGLAWNCGHIPSRNFSKWGREVLRLLWTLNSSVSTGFWGVDIGFISRIGKTRPIWSLFLILVCILLLK